MAATAVRRLPTQARSRARVDRVVDAAATMIARRGIDPVTMTDIAEEAGMALTAVYRYFPNKRAVVRELALRTFAHDADTLVSAGHGVDVPVEQLVAAGIREYWRRHAAEPFRLHLRAAVHADAELSALDLDESRRNARVIAELVAGATGRSDVDVLERRSLLLVELLDGLVRLAARVGPDQAEALVEEFAAMAVAQLLRPPPGTAGRPR